MRAQKTRDRLLCAKFGAYGPRAQQKAGLMIIVDTLACKRYHDFDSALMKLRVRFANAADESGRNANLFT